MQNYIYRAKSKVESHISPLYLTRRKLDQSPDIATNHIVANEGVEERDAHMKCSHVFVVDSTVKLCHVCDKAVPYIRDPGYKCEKCKLQSHNICRFG